jgi:hypothetical protein
MDLMDRWPRVSFVEHCIITHFFTIRESDIVTYEINPKDKNDVKPNNEDDILSKIQD